MKLKQGLFYTAAALTVVGGSVLALGAHSWNQEVEAEEVAANAQAAGVDKDVAGSSSNANAGTENYWGGRGYGGRGYAGRGWGGRGWGRSYGYRGGHWGYYGPGYYGYSCRDGWYYCR
jgi:hypothetical protein